MNILGRLARVLAVIGSLLAAEGSSLGPAAAQHPSDGPRSADLYRYDPSQPLDVRIAGREEYPGALVLDLSYAGSGATRVEAWLVTPQTAGRHAAILFGHWGGGDRTEFLPEALRYARDGMVSLLPSYPWSRSGASRTRLRYSSDPEHDFAIYVQAVVELRRGLDLLAARTDVDLSRLGYVGHSYGAQWGAILSAVDRRPRTFVLIAGVPDLAALYLESNDPEYAELRAREPERVARLLDVMAPLAGVRHVGRAAPASLFFQAARYEQNFQKAATERYFAAASEPKRMRWYPTSHDVNDPQALADRATWLRRELLRDAVGHPKVR